MTTLQGSVIAHAANAPDSLSPPRTYRIVATKLSGFKAIESICPFDEHPRADFGQRPLGPAIGV
jgi:hypothetical protein